MELWQLNTLMLDHHHRVNLDVDTTFGFYKDGQLSMGNKAVQLDVNGKTLTVDDKMYKLTSGLLELITSTT